jgi:hypothetical protein
MIEMALQDHRRAHPGAKVAPYALNPIIHRSNDRLEQDLDVCMRHRVPMIISKPARRELVERLRAEYASARARLQLPLRERDRVGDFKDRTYAGISVSPSWMRPACSRWAWNRILGHMSWMTFIS